jgi:hypothetical protein
MTDASVRVLVLGASGTIGRAIQNEARGVGSLELLPASHRGRPGHIRLDYESLLTADSHRIAAVVNCVGIWSGTAEEFERVQYTVPVALFGREGDSSMRWYRPHRLASANVQAPIPFPFRSTSLR